MKPYRERATDDTALAQLARLSEASADPVWIIDLDGRILIMNASALAVFDHEMTPGDHWSDAWPQDSAPTMSRTVAAALDRRRQGFRFQYSASDGARTYLDFTISPVMGPDSNVEMLVATARNVTDQIEARAFINVVLDALPQALTVHDLRSREIVLCNASAEDFQARMSGAAPSGWTSENDQAAAHARRIVRNEIVETADGPRCISTLKIATYDDSGARHLITLAEDITDEQNDQEATRRALRTAEAADQAKSAFLANMNHELRTPLNGVVAGLDALRRRLSRDEYGDLVDMIWGSAVTLASRIDELSAARADAPAHDLRMETIDLVAVVQQVAEPFIVQARDKGLTLSVSFSDKLAPRLTGDRNGLIAALRPLLDNSVKFTDVGETALEVDVVQEGWVRLSVFDRGIGFDPAVKEQLFKPFARQDQSLTRRFGGLGLGLSSARGLVERMGGRIDAQVRPDGGSVFWIDLPMPAASNDETGAAAAAPSAPLRILIADDHPTNRRVLKLILDEIGEVTAAVDGHEAVEAAHTTEFDIILMDIQMPVMDGITAVARIREIERAAERSAVPIIMLTANTEDEHVRASQAAGADRHIAKPFTAKALLEAIDSVRRQPKTKTRPQTALQASA